MKSHLEIRNARECSTTEAVDGEIAEEALDHVQPRAAGGGEVNVKTRTALKPPLYGGMFVRRVVVRNDMDLFARLHTALDEPKELEPFGVAVTARAGGQHRTVQSVEGGEQCRCAVAFVIARHRSCTAFLEWQAGLSAI